MTSPANENNVEAAAAAVLLEFIVLLTLKWLKCPNLGRCFSFAWVKRSQWSKAHETPCADGKPWANAQQRVWLVNLNAGDRLFNQSPSFGLTGFWKIHLASSKIHTHLFAFACLRTVLTHPAQTQRFLHDLLIEILKEQCVVQDTSPFPAPLLIPTLARPNGTSNSTLA